MQVSLLTLFAVLAALSASYAEKCRIEAYNPFVMPAANFSFHAFVEQCFRELNIPKIDITKDITTLHTFPCLDKCVYKKYGFLSENGTIDSAKAKMAFDGPLWPFVDPCIMRYAKEPNLCDKVQSTSDCFIDILCAIYEARY